MFVHRPIEQTTLFIWFLGDYYGRVIFEPTIVEHNGGLVRLSGLGLRGCREKIANRDRWRYTASNRPNSLRET